MSARPLAAAVLLAAVAASCAPTLPPPGPTAVATTPGQCFLTSRIYAHKQAPGGSVNLKVGADQTWRVDLAAPCAGLATAPKILVDSRTSGSQVCAGQDATVIVPAGAGQSICPTRGVRRLTTAEVAALPAAQRP